MEDVKSLKDKRKFLSGILNMKGVKVHFEGLRESVVQYVIANSSFDEAEEYVDVFERFGSEELKKFIYRKLGGK